MTESDLHRLERAWRDAPDADVARALSAPGDYEPQALAVITQEAARRGIDSATVAPDASPEPISAWDGLPVRLAGAAWSHLPGHRLVAAAMCGGALPLIWMLVIRRLSPATTASRVACLVAVLLLFLAGLTGVAWPLLRYRAAVLVTLVASAAAASVGFVQMLVVMPRRFREHWVDSALWPSMVSFAMTWAISCLAICAAVWVRRRWWPVYGPGCCVRCGYDLRGQVEPRCPECGEAFDRADVEGAEKVSG